ncbi:NACHT and WD repeat domain-containing protein [Pelatocladus sp. BLCC-F211]|uniref:NACHT and WD repeat domain-containing protein n=1 Tax=Pelatocladus sp. BLCC-F211 TaxID=3342752 RepID=UPI0035BB984C
MNDTPYQGLNPYTEEDALFFFGREAWREKVTDRLMVSRLTVLYGESGVGKSSLLQAGVANYLKLFGEENRKNTGVPKIAAVVFKNWKDNNREEDLLEKLRENIKTAVAKAINKDKPEEISRLVEEIIKKQKDKEQETREKILETLNIKSENQNQKLDIVNSYLPSEFIRELQACVEIISGEQGGGELFIILDQFEEYFQYHAQQGNEEDFTTEFARAVNYPNLAVHFLISIRSDEFYRLEGAFQGTIFNILGNCIELEFLDRESAKEAIKKPIERYNFIQCLKNSRLIVFTGEKYAGKSFMLQGEVIPYLSKTSKESESSESSWFLPVLFNTWNGNPLNDLVKQIQEDIQIFWTKNKYEGDNFFNKITLQETLQIWTKYSEQQTSFGNSHDVKLLIILDHFEKYIEAHSSWETEEFTEKLKQVFTEFPINILVSIRDSYLKLLKPFIVQLKEAKEKNTECEVPCFTLSEDSLIFQNQEKLTNIEIAEIYEEVFAKKIIEVLTNLAKEEKPVVTPFLQLVMTELWKKKKYKDGKRILSLKTVKKLGKKRIVPQTQSEERKKTLSEDEIIKEGIEEIIQHYVDSTIKKLEEQSIKSALLSFWWKWYLAIQNSQPMNGAKRDWWFISLAYHLIGRAIKSNSLNTVSRVLYYLSTPSGSKRALSVREIVAFAEEDAKVLKQLELPKMEKTEVVKLLDELDRKRILRPVRSSPKQDKIDKPYEIYFDGLMPALQSWRTKYISQLRSISLKQNLPTQSLALCRRGKRELAALLACQAYGSHKDMGYPKDLSQVDEALREILQYPYFSCLLTVPNKSSNKRDFWQVKFNGHGTMLAASNHDGSLWVWDLEKEGTTPKLIGWQEKAHDACHMSPGSNLDMTVVFSQDNQMLISSGRDGAIKLWDLSHLEINNLNVQRINCISEIRDPDQKELSQDGFTSVSLINRQDGNKLLAAGNWTGNVWLWDISQPQQPEQFREPLQRQLDWLATLQKWLDNLIDGLSKLFSRKNHRKNRLSDPWIWSVDTSPDGKLLAAGGGDGIVYLWNIEDPLKPKLLRSLKKHKQEIFCVAFAPDGKWLASGSRDCTVCLWKLDQINVSLKKAWKGNKGCVRAISFSSENPNSVSDGEVYKKHSMKLASASEDQTIRVWNLENLEEEPEVLHGHSYSVSSVAFDPNNPQRLVSCSWDRTMRFWTLGSEPKNVPVLEQDVIWDKIIIKFFNLRAESKIFKPRQKEVIAVTWIDETHFALVCSNGTLEVRECDNYINRNKLLTSCSVSPDISTVAFFGEGKQQKIAVGNSDGSIWIWDLNFQDINKKPNKNIKILPETNKELKINSLAFSSDGKLIAAVIENNLQVWELESKGEYKILPNLPLNNKLTVTSVLFQPYAFNDEQIVAIAYKAEKISGRVLGKINLLNLKTGNFLTKSPLVHEKTYEDAPIILAFSPDGKWLVSGSDQRYLLLWDTSQLDNGQSQKIPPKSESESKLNCWVTALAFKDNRWVASGRYDGSIELWDLENLDNDPFVLQGHKEKITAIAFSPDKKQLASASFDNTVRLWTIETEELAQKLKQKLYRDLTRQERDKFLG